eukprot:scaffold254764_cov33-Tisochrysis_lutea.AAC.1
MVVTPWAPSYPSCGTQNTRTYCKSSRRAPGRCFLRKAPLPPGEPNSIGSRVTRARAARGGSARGGDGGEGCPQSSTHCSADLSHSASAVLDALAPTPA